MDLSHAYGFSTFNFPTSKIYTLTNPVIHIRLARQIRKGEAHFMIQIFVTIMMARLRIDNGSGGFQPTRSAPTAR